VRDTSNPPSVEGENAAELCDWSNTQLRLGSPTATLVLILSPYPVPSTTFTVMRSASRPKDAESTTRSIPHLFLGARLSLHIQ